MSSPFCPQVPPIPCSPAMPLPTLAPPGLPLVTSALPVSRRRLCQSWFTFSLLRVPSVLRTPAALASECSRIHAPVCPLSHRTRQNRSQVLLLLACPSLPEPHSPSFPALPLTLPFSGTFSDTVARPVHPLSAGPVDNGHAARPALLCVPPAPPPPSCPPPPPAAATTQWRLLWVPQAPSLQASAPTPGTHSAPLPASGQLLWASLRPSKRPSTPPLCWHPGPAPRSRLPQPPYLDCKGPRALRGRCLHPLR